MAKVWVQVWTAKVAGSVEVEESELQKVQGLESVSKLIPMLVKASEHSGWEMVPNWGKQSVVVAPSQSEKVQDLQLAEEMVEVMEPWRD
jgi:predicted amidohydrolase YtcJ